MNVFNNFILSSIEEQSKIYVIALSKEFYELLTVLKENGFVLTSIHREFVNNFINEHKEFGYIKNLL